MVGYLLSVPAGTPLYGHGCASNRQSGRERLYDGGTQTRLSHRLQDDHAMRWNDMMYHDYSQGYMDLMDGNLETQSYHQFLHLGARIDETDQNQVKNYSNKFKRRKDYYRRYRDLSAFILIGIYALSVIDAYVDASLSEFDISEDLSMKVSPTIIRNSNYSLNPVKSTSLGVQCSLHF